MTFEVPDQATQIFISGGPDKMNVIGHDHIGIQVQSFILAAKVQAFQHDIPVTFSAENIDPANNSKCQKVSGGLVPYFIAGSVSISHFSHFTFVSCCRAFSPAAVLSRLWPVDKIQVSRSVKRSASQMQLTEYISTPVSIAGF